MDTSNIIAISLFGGFILAVIFQMVYFIIFNKRKFKKQEDRLMEKALELVHRMDEIEEKINNGGNGKMDKEIVKVAKYLSKKIDEAKEEIIEEFNQKLDELTEGVEEDLPDKKEEKNSEDDFDEKDEEFDLDEYDDLEDYDGERKMTGVAKKADEINPKKKKK